VTLDDLATALIQRNAAMFSCSFVEKTGMWQANIRIHGNSGWQCSIEETIGEATAAALVSVDLGHRETAPLAAPDEDLFG
jgi:hypothetical protein